MSLAPELLAILVCPKCKSKLEHYPGPPEVLVCRESQLVYRVEDGIPVMLIDEAAPLDEAIYPPVSP
ncbi:MAG: Trm112 family protein [Gemmatimonadaceae bacterium]|nr:Trm112 family protein [Gemmatimonadaceae bacterium]